MGAVKEKYEGKFTGTSNELDFIEALKKRYQGCASRPRRRAC
jgi:hypothetical protein